MGEGKVSVMGKISVSEWKENKLDVYVAYVEQNAVLLILCVVNEC